jgi:SAM-dependent methyltransferase
MVEAWDAIATGYAQRAASFTGSFAPELLAAVDINIAGAVGSTSPVAPPTSSLQLVDVAAGSGVVALAAAQRPGVALVLACDISPAMLAELEAQAASLPPRAAAIETMPCDCTALPLPDNTFDAAVSNFGVIFAQDVQAGLREMVRVTKPGGRVAFTTWGKTPAFAQIEDTWRAVFPETSPGLAHGTPQHEAASRIRQQLASIATLDDVTVEAIEHELVVDSPEAYWERMLVRA